MQAQQLQSPQSNSSCSRPFALDVASRLGIVVGLMLLCTAVATSWWTYRTSYRAAQAAAVDRLEILGRTLVEDVSEELAQGRTNHARLLLQETAWGHRLHRARLMLADTTVIADSRLGLRAVPDPPQSPWPAVDPAARGTDKTDSQHVTVRQMCVVPGKGELILEMETEISDQNWFAGDMFLGVGGIAALGMLAWLGVFRWIKRSLQGQRAISSAIIDAVQTKQTAESLCVAEEFGVDAKAWNELMRERDVLRTSASIKQSVNRSAGSERTDAGFGEAADAMWVGLIILDSDSRIESINGAAAVMLGRKKDTLLGEPLASVLPSGEECLSMIDAVSRRQRKSMEISTLQQNQDKTVLHWTSKPFRKGETACTLLVVEDVTQQRVADESRNAFVAQATHELRSPLTNMRLYLETLVDQGDSDPSIKARCMNVLAGEVRRLERIVSDMLSVSEIEAGSLKISRDDVAPRGIFEEIENDFRALAEDKEITLQFELPPKFLTLQADRDKLTLLLHNLVGNALKYTPNGGMVKVVVEQTPEQLSVQVVDNGIGIRQEELELIFDRFYRAKDRRISSITGSGLGLALARQVARLHGGDIQAQSTIDKGSTFTFVMPNMPASAVVSKAA